MYLRLKHSLPTRIHHWINGPALAIMIWSGLLIYWANGVYTIRLFGLKVFGFTEIKFFPDWFYDNRFYSLDHQLATGMAWHFTVGLIFALNGLVYFGYTVWSGAWRELVPTRGSLAGAWQVVLHDLKIRKGPLPEAKFNHAQRIAYTGVVLMGGASLLTGLAIYKPVQAGPLTRLLGGYEAARLEHFALTLGYVAFFVIHIAQVIKAGWNNFRSMVIGVEAVPGPAPEAADGRQTA